MSGSGILIAGASIANDSRLVEAVAQIAETMTEASAECVVTTLQVNPTIQLLLLEIDEANFGAALLQRLLREFPEVQVVCIDGDGDRDLLVEAFSLGAKDAFPKPINLELLTERVGALLSGS